MLSLIASLALAPAAAVADADPKNEKDPIICERRGHHSVGTRLGKKMCMKKSDWEITEKHTQKELQRINERGNNPAEIGAR